MFEFFTNRTMIQFSRYIFSLQKSRTLPILTNFHSIIFCRGYSYYVDRTRQYRVHRLRFYQRVMDIPYWPFVLNKITRRTTLKLGKSVKLVTDGF